MANGWEQILIGAAEVTAGIWTANPTLIVMGSGMVLSGIGSLLDHGPGVTGSEGVVAKPWNVVYGTALVDAGAAQSAYIEETGDNNKFLHYIYVLAAHPCEAVLRLMIDGKFVQIDGSGNSFTPVQQHNISISSIARVNGVVTVTLAADIPLLQTGDFVRIHNTTFDQTLGGIFPVTVLNHVSGGGVGPGSVTFSYLCGGSNVSGGSPGQCDTQWPNWQGNIHVEYALG